MILSFKDFVNEAYQAPVTVTQNTAPKPVDTIYFRNTVQKDLWEKELVSQISDGFWERRSSSNWRFWADLKADVDAQNPRVTKTTGGNVSFNFSAKELLDAVGDRMIEIGKVHFPEYNKRALITDLNDISDICKTAGYGSSSAKSKRRITTGFDDKDIMRITDILKKANGDVEKAKMLSNKMAKAIDDGAKALRRAKAAESIGEENIASIFYGRVADLNFGDQWRASTSLRDLNKKTGLFDDDDFDLDDPTA